MTFTLSKVYVRVQNDNFSDQTNVSVSNSMRKYSAGMESIYSRAEYSESENEMRLSKKC